MPTDKEKAKALDFLLDKCLTVERWMGKGELVICEPGRDPDRYLNSDVPRDILATLDALVPNSEK